ncbi:MAG: hypothetical protein K5985_08000 [Lachnospiraceae bacterium]|nr:hypothetical protein [Lachnospiraceae bacterium]
MSFKCKSCTGDLIFNIAGQDLFCPFCESRFPVSEYTEDKAAEEHEVFEATVFTCTQCGAELISPDNSAVAFCSYCGTEALLEGRVSEEKRPKRMIPFKITKEDCRTAYLQKVKASPYAPKEFSDPKFLEKFRGIYIPYWEYDMAFEKSPEYKVRESYTSGDYNITNEYKVKPDLSGTAFKVVEDASSGFDDEIARQIAPYQEKELVDFNPAYLAGFFADTADVEGEVYEDLAKLNAEDRMLSAVTGQFRSGATTQGVPAASAERSEFFGTRVKEREMQFLPVWFLTWRKGKRVAYGVVNGATKQLAAEIPVDIGKFLGISAIIAAALFLILTITSTLLMPSTVLSISAIAGVLAMYFYKKEIISIRDREKHINDLGALTGEKLEKAKKLNIAGRKKGPVGMISFFVGLFICLGLALMDGAILAAPILFVLALGLFLQSLKPVFEIKEKNMFAGLLLSLAAELVAVGMTFANPIQDWYYYIACVVVLGGITVTCLILLMEYNLLTTRSLPDFHGREGGNKDAGN